MLERILIPHDGSKAAAAVLPIAQLLARQGGGQVIVYRAADTLAALLADYPGAAHAPGAEEDDAKAGADEVARTLAREGLPARSRSSVGPAVEGILAAAAEERATLIAMATHGRTGLARWNLGSVTERVIRQSSLPVLVARSFAVSSAPRIAHVLVPIDGSAASLEVIPAVAAIAAPFDCQVSIAHFASDYAGGAMPAAQTYLDEAAEAFARAGVRVETVLRRGAAASGIVDYGLLDAAEEGVDLVIMSTHGRSGVTRFLLGSVTERVLRHAVTPILVLPRAKAA